MSNTITMPMGITSNDSTAPQVQSKTQTITQSGSRIYADRQSIATSATTINVGSIGTLGVAHFRNCDPTNFVKIGVDVGGTPGYLVKLKPGEEFAFRLVPGVTLKGIADTGAVQLQVWISDD